jgi:ribonuclease HII
MDKQIKYIIGIDEAGRGPIAGPVSVGCCVIKKNNLVPEALSVKDSKKLSEKKREEWLEWMNKTKEVRYTVAMIGSEVIDEIGITGAIKLAIKRVLYRIEKLGIAPEEVMVLLDGGLKAPEKYINQETIIKGDEKEPTIALASIVAKVTRDKYMVKLSKEYQNYGLEKHKGYGTKAHYEAIQKLGLSKIHRRSFCKNILQK